MKHINNLKSLALVSLLSLSAITATAGGLVTNSNQSASFLRNPARDGVIDIDGVYTNPAGVCFMPKGFHLGLTIQHPEQQRNVTTTFPTLAYNKNFLGQDQRTYEGAASAPLVPSFQAAYVFGRWTAMASFAFTGGGGKCEFGNGIGSIESAYSLLMMQAMQAKGLGAAYQGYTMDAFMKGRQYYYGLQLGAGYKVNDHLAVAVGLRAVIGDATYSGYVRNVCAYTSLPNMPQIPLNDYAIEMTTDQSCVGWTPVIGIDWRINDHWNVAAKYEFRTKMNLKNKSDMNDFARQQPVLDKFNDEKTERVRDDVPGTLGVGLQYSPITSLRFNGGFHFYDDCNAKKYNDEQELIDHGTIEFMLGAAYDINSWLTVSAGWQNTSYGLSDEAMQDMSYNCSSNMMAMGFRFKPSKKVSIDLGYMHNFYKDRTVETSNYQGTGLTKTDLYTRTNYVFAAGVNLDF